MSDALKRELFAINSEQDVAIEAYAADVGSDGGVRLRNSKTQTPVLGVKRSQMLEIRSAGAAT